MATATPALRPLPAQTVPVIDPKTGIIDPDWYRWLKLLEVIVRGLRTEV